MPGHTTPAALLIHQRLRALTRALPGAKKGDAEQVHQARVATRRLREALPLVLAGPRQRAFGRKVRRLTRALGPVRELDVALATLDEIGHDGGAPPAAIARLKQVVRQERRLLHAGMCREIGRADLEKLRRRIVALAAKGRLDAPERRDPKLMVRGWEIAARRAMRLQAAIENAAGIYLPDRLHDVRIAVKKLRYALEVTRELSGSRAAARLHVLKEAQDLLGRMHDLEVLIARVRAIQGSSQAPNLRLSADLDRLVRRLETECRQIHGHYMSLRPKLVAVCDHTVAKRADMERAKVHARSVA